MVNTEENTLLNLAKNAKAACQKLSSLSTTIKNDILQKLAVNLKANYDRILVANQKDLENAKLLVDKNELSASLYKRLALSETKFKEMVQGVKDVAKLEDPVGKILYQVELDDGLLLNKVSCPIGVIGVIFEARPDVVVQISALAIKSGNAVILKGGAEAINTNKELVSIIKETIVDVFEFPYDAINLVTTREEVNEMLKLDEYIDLLIPRGSNEFVKYIQNNTRIPVLGHSEGICHVYIDKNADLNKAWAISLDSKINYAAACNAAETLIVHKDIVPSFLPEMINKFKNSSVEVRVEQKLIDQLDLQEVKPSIDDDWDTEYNDYIISIKDVNSLAEAIEFINEHGSGHTDSIVTEDRAIAEKFMEMVDSAGVYWNASTRFADGYRYGLGAEVGISTNKTHARGPVGLEGMTIYKYKLYGTGQIVEDYSTGRKKFKHKIIIKK